MCQVEVDIAWIKNKKHFQASKVLPTKYAFQKREKECEWQEGWLMNKYFSAELMKAMFTARAYLFTPSLPRALRAPWASAFSNGTEKPRTFQLQVTVVTVSVETMSHRRSTWDELWQHLTCVTRVSCDMAVAMVRLHVQEMC